MIRFHLERALFVIGNPDAGKSTQLRHLFRDVRFHGDSNIPTASRTCEKCTGYRTRGCLSSYNLAA